MMNDSDTIALHADTYFPGSSEDNPIALIYKGAPDPFSKKLKANATYSNWVSNQKRSNFHSDL